MSADDTIIIVERSGKWYVFRIFADNVEDMISKIEQGYYINNAVNTQEEAIKIARRMTPAEYGIRFL
jgi:hypothetical protein